MTKLEEAKKRLGWVLRNPDGSNVLMMADLMRAMTEEGIYIRISNKGAISNCWWVYLSGDKEVIKQGEDFVEAFLEATKELLGD